jgi:tetratricopeptide (TPR) repeat protein
VGSALGSEVSKSWAERGKSRSEGIDADLPCAILSRLMTALRLVTLMTLATPFLAAQAHAETDDAAAKSHYDLGVVAYRDGRFAEAIDEFKAADVLRPSPALSFNIAQCFEKQADLKSARHYYEEYLQRKPAAEDRQSVETTIASIDAELSQQGNQAAPILVTTEPAVTAPAPVATTNEAAPESHRHLASWILLGAGAAGLIAGGSLNFAASQVVEGPTTVVQTGAQVTAAYNQANGLFAGAVVGYGVGAALGIAGFIVYYLESKK